MIITGKIGAGKTVLTVALVKLLAEQGRKVIVLTSSTDNYETEYDNVHVHEWFGLEESKDKTTTLLRSVIKELKGNQKQPLEAGQIRWTGVDLIIDGCFAEMITSKTLAELLGKIKFESKSDSTICAVEDRISLDMFSKEWRLRYAVADSLFHCVKHRGWFFVIEGPPWETKSHHSLNWDIAKVNKYMDDIDYLAMGREGYVTIGEVKIWDANILRGFVTGNESAFKSSLKAS